MALANTHTNLLDFYGSAPVATSLEQFETANRRLITKKQLLEDIQNEYDLLLRQTFNIYKREVEYIFFDSNSISNARNWLAMISTGKDSEGKKLDKRRKYEEKTSFESLHHILERFLGVSDIEITEIIDGNYGEFWDINFKSNKREWSLTIPNSVSLSTFIHDAESGHPDHAFKLRLYYVHQNVFRSVGSTFVENELTDMMAAGIKKYCNEGAE